MPPLWAGVPSAQPGLEVGVECAPPKMGVVRIPPALRNHVEGQAGGGRRWLRRELMGAPSHLTPKNLISNFS
jgi:hypothetical protein